MVKGSQLGENFFSARRQRDHHGPAVHSSLHSADKPILRSPLDEFHHGMVPLLEKFGKFRDGCRTAPGKSGYSKHQLVLLWSDPALPRRLLAKAKELSQVVAEQCKVPNNVRHSGVVLVRKLQFG
jgi:hypothetical protein